MDDGKKILVFGAGKTGRSFKGLVEASIGKMVPIMPREQITTLR